MQPFQRYQKLQLLIIGNEILNGSVVDTNTPWLAKLLYRFLAPTEYSITHA